MGEGMAHFLDVYNYHVSDIINVLGYPFYNCPPPLDVFAHEHSFFNNGLDNVRWASFMSDLQTKLKDNQHESSRLCNWLSLWCFGRGCNIFLLYALLGPWFYDDSWCVSFGIIIAPYTLILYGIDAERSERETIDATLVLSSPPRKHTFEFCCQLIIALLWYSLLSVLSCTRKLLTNAVDMSRHVLTVHGTALSKTSVPCTSA